MLISAHRLQVAFLLGALLIASFLAAAFFGAAWAASSWYVLVYDAAQNEKYAFGEYDTQQDALNAKGEFLSRNGSFNGNVNEAFILQDDWKPLYWRKALEALELPCPVRETWEGEALPTIFWPSEGETLQAVVGESLEFYILFCEPDRETVEFSRGSGPSAVTLDPVSGRWSWTPAKEFVGTHALWFSAV